MAVTPPAAVIAVPPAGGAPRTIVCGVDGCAPTEVSILGTASMMQLQRAILPAYFIEPAAMIHNALFVSNGMAHASGTEAIPAWMTVDVVMAALPARALVVAKRPPMKAAACECAAANGRRQLRAGLARTRREVLHSRGT